jgi:hypothetical protein
MAAQSSASSEAGKHVLPRWFEWFQDHVVLSLLIIAGMILNGLMFASGVVPDMEDPSTWGYLRGGMFVVFFLAGAGLTGCICSRS